MRVTQQLLPGHPEGYYVEARSGWFEEAAKLRNAILKDVREAVVGYWLEHGMTFAEIARIPEKEMPRRVGETIDTLLAAK